MVSDSRTTVNTSVAKYTCEIHKHTSKIHKYTCKIHLKIHLQIHVKVCTLAELNWSMVTGHLNHVDCNSEVYNRPFNVHWPHAILCGPWKCIFLWTLKILTQKIEQDFLLARKYCLPPAWPFWRRPRSSVTIFWRSSVMIARLPCGQLTVGHDSGWFGLWTAYCGTLGCLCFLVVQQLFLGQASLDKDTHRQWQK